MCKLEKLGELCPRLECHLKALHYISHLTYIYIPAHSHATYSNFLSTENFTTSSMIISKFETSEEGKIVSLKKMRNMQICMPDDEVADSTAISNTESTKTTKCME